MRNHLSRRHHVCIYKMYFYGAIRDLDDQDQMKMQCQLR